MRPMDPPLEQSTTYANPLRACYELDGEEVIGWIYVDSIRIITSHALSH